MSPDSFEDLVARLEQGDEDAAEEVYQRYANGLIRMAHSHLDQRMRQKFDAEDVLQSVFRSFFQRQVSNPFQLEDWDSLWNLLIRITLNKCGRRIEFYRAAKRSVQQETNEQPLDPESRDALLCLTREPTPDEAAMLSDTIDKITGPLSDLERQVFEQTLQGYTATEIGEQVNRSSRHVRRILDQLRSRLRDLSPEL